jgi:succinyl-diaminopimelate desuccinylase
VSFVELCRKFIAIDTSPQAGTLEAGLWLSQQAKQYGLEVDLQEESFNGQLQSNVFVRTQQPQKEEFILQSHFDTGNPGSHSLWTETLLNPFHATIKEGKLYGLGAAEAKIDLLCKLEALRSFSGRTDWKVAPVVVGTSGEELGMQGMLRALRRNKFSAKYALVGEPSEHKLIYAGKGYATLEFYIPFSEEERHYRIDHDLKESVSTQSKMFRGKATHSSEAHSADNAINKAFDYLLQIPESVVLMEIEGGTNHNIVPHNCLLELDLYGGVKDPMVKKLRAVYMLLQQMGSDFLITKDPDFSPGYPTMNLGLVKAHEDHVHLTVSVRIPPVVKEGQYEAWLLKLQEGAILVGGQCRVGDYKRPYRTDLNSDFVKTCSEALSLTGMPETFIAQPTCTEMSLLSRRGIVCLGFGAGSRKNLSSIAEANVSIEELNKSIRFYRNVIEGICL